MGTIRELRAGSEGELEEQWMIERLVIEQRDKLNG